MITAFLIITLTITTCVTTIILVKANQPSTKTDCICGGKWVNTETDSEGKGYNCNKCNNHIWIPNYLLREKK